MANTKTCSKCRTTKPADYFNKCSKATDGMQRYCRACSSEYKKSRPHDYAADPAEVKKKRADRARVFYRNNRGRLAEEKAARAAQKRQGDAFDLVAFILGRINEAVLGGYTTHADRVCELLGVHCIEEARTHFECLAALRGAGEYRIATTGGQSHPGAYGTEAWKRARFVLYNLTIVEEAPRC